MKTAELEKLLLKHFGFTEDGAIDVGSQLKIFAMLDQFKQPSTEPNEGEADIHKFMEPIAQELGYHNLTSLNIGIIQDEILFITVIETIHKQFASHHHPKQVAVSEDALIEQLVSALEQFWYLERGWISHVKTTPEQRIQNAESALTTHKEYVDKRDKNFVPLIPKSGESEVDPIKFAEWILNKYSPLEAPDKFSWWDRRLSGQYYTTKELYQLYLNETKNNV